MQVRGWSDETKRGFLVQKGLTNEEIDEAFKRVVSSTVKAPPPPLLLPPTGGTHGQA